MNTDLLPALLFAGLYYTSVKASSRLAYGYPIDKSAMMRWIGAPVSVMHQLEAYLRYLNLPYYGGPLSLLLLQQHPTKRPRNRADTVPMTRA